MWRLAHALRRSGMNAELFGYLAARERFDAIVRRLAARIAREADDRYLVIGHSLGGLLLRAALGQMPAGTPRPRRVIMLGTPNRSPRLARQFGGAWWYHLLNGDAGALLADDDRIARIPPLIDPVTIIAGTRGINGRWSPFGDDVNDGIVAADETRLDGAEWIAVAARHPFMMNSPRVRQLVRERCDVSDPPVGRHLSK
jgi:pimeloyl-ACP methyl ester carboxylesterase